VCKTIGGSVWKKLIDWKCLLHVRVCCSDLNKGKQQAGTNKWRKMMMSRKTLFCFSVMLILGLAVVANAAVVAEYDASAVTTLRPGEDTPAWTVGGNQTEVFGSDDMGDYLSLHLNGIGNEAQNSGDYLYWSSPATTNMDKGVTDYSLEVKMQPVDDWISSGYAYEAQNMVVMWSDDTNWYSVSFDKDKDDAGAGTDGRIVRAKYGWVNIVDSVDWSTPHTVGIAYMGTYDRFYFSIDGTYASYIEADDLAVGAVHAPYQDKMYFGDGTTGGGNGSTYGPDYDSDWYFARLHDVAIPEPTTLALLGMAGLLGLRRRRKA